MDKIQHLSQVFANRNNDENIVYEKIKTPSNEYHFIPGLEGTNVIYALHAMYIEKDFNKAKLMLYKAARIAEFTSDAYNWRVMDNGTYQITYALLSDNKPLINRYSVLKNTINNDTSLPYQYANCIQNILQENWEKFNWNINCMERFIKLPRFKMYTNVMDMLYGFKQKDETLIKRGLEAMTANYKQRNKDAIIYKFFSIDTAGFTKLAWLKGYEIYLQSPVIPMELMPVKPLEHYEDYPFLK